MADVPSTPMSPKRSTIIKKWIGTLARLILGGALVLAGALKVGDYDQSLLAVQAYTLPIPTWMEEAIAFGQPAVEIIVGGLILAGVFTRVTAAMGGLLMVVFIGGISWAWAKGLNIDCGCFTPGGFLPDTAKTKYAQDIVRDIGFVACAVWLSVLPRTAWSVDGWMGRGNHRGQEQEIDLSESVDSTTRDPAAPNAPVERP